MSLSTIELPQFTADRFRSLQQTFHDANIIGYSPLAYKKLLFKEFEQAEMKRGHAFLSRQQPVTERVFSGYIEPLRTAQSEELLTPDLLSSFISQSSAALEVPASSPEITSPIPAPTPTLPEKSVISFDDDDDSFDDSFDYDDSLDDALEEDWDADTDIIVVEDTTPDTPDEGTLLPLSFDDEDDSFGTNEGTQHTLHTPFTQPLSVSTSTPPPSTPPAVDTEVVVETFTVLAPPVVESPYEVPTDLRSFIKQNPYCTLEDAKRYFSEKEIKKQISLGRVIYRKGRLSL